MTSASVQGSQKMPLLASLPLVQGVHVILSSIIPLTAIFCCQPLVFLGIAGLPTSWWDVLVLDLGLGRLVYQGIIATFVRIWGGILALVRPTIPGTAPKWLRENCPLLGWFFFSDDPSVTVVNSCCAPENSDFFLYVNGMCSTRLLALDTGRVLADMFHRDITVVHNPTDSVMVDLFECVIGKLWTGKSWSTTVPCAWAFDEIKRALKDRKKTKVVLISHSQGTIIASDLLCRLWNDAADDKILERAMEKLEMYSFANAAQTMEQNEDGYPYMESICNHRDNVGMLGANAPDRVKKAWNIQLGGKVIYPNKIRWGHMISSHYLKHLKAGDYSESKLHNYMSTPANASGLLAARRM